MPKQTHADPYVYPGTSTLINKFNVQDSDKLQELEALFFLSKKSEPLPTGIFDYTHLKEIHRHFFSDIYEWAGQERTIDIAKGNSYFCHVQYITKESDKLFLKLKNDNYLCELSAPDFYNKLSFYFNEINAIHPFREGNGRTQRAFCDVIAKQAGYSLNWTEVETERYIQASIAGFSHGDYDPMESIFQEISTQLDLTQTKNKLIEINDESSQLLKEYVTKQLALTDALKQKTQHISSNPALHKEMSQASLQINNELKNIASKLMSDLTLNEYMNQSRITLIQKNPSFAEINDRFQHNIMTIPDVTSVLRHAKQSISAEQSLSQTNSRCR